MKTGIKSIQERDELTQRKYLMNNPSTAAVRQRRKEPGPTVRIVKEHDERETEILDIAEKLFYTQGYDKTPISDVIDAVGIAKGTFYYYFNSKADLLDKIMDRQAKKIDEIIDRVLEEPEADAIEEFNNIWAAIGSYKAKERDVMIMLVRAMYSDENIILRTKLTRIRVKTVAPRIARVISRGINEGLFHVDNPEITAEIIMSMGTYLGDEFASLFLEDRLDKEGKEEFIHKCRMFENIVVRILGAPEGSISICDDDAISVFFED